MPELPDLEVFKVNIFAGLTSKKLVDIETFNLNKVNAARETMLADLADRELLRIGRSGKELLFDFGGGNFITVHLMLSGRTSIVASDEVSSVKHKIFSMRFENETVVFGDMGRLCTVRYMPKLSKTPDAFGDDFTPEYFLGAARKKPRVSVKAFLIDQSVVKGIGNAYADEILWAARISPLSLTGKIPEERLTALYHAVGSVLKSAIASINEIAPGIIAGEERSFLKVHNKNVKTTETGYPITVERISSKITYYTEEQVLYF